MTSKRALSSLAMPCLSGREREQVVVRTARSCAQPPSTVGILNINMKRGYYPLSLLAIAVLTVNGWTQPAISQSEGSAPIQLRQWPLLLADDSGVANRSGLVRTVHIARTDSSPVLVADRPWEAGRVYVYGSAYQDETTGEYRLWYVGAAGGGGSSAPTSGRRLRGGAATLLATSTDGIAWRKPELNLYAHGGSTANNIVYDLHSVSVLRDDFETKPEKRYKMLGHSSRPAPGYQAAYSADGVHWKSYPNETVLKHGDTSTLTQDPRTGEYLAYHKRPAQVRGFGRRVVWLSRSRDFQIWSEPQLVFAPDEQDDTWASRPNERTEVYNMSVFPHATGFIGLPAIFRVMEVKPRDSVSRDQSSFDGPIDIQLATSVDGRTWQRSWPRANILPRGAPGSFDGGTILGVSSTPIHTANETWVYYTGINTTHGGPIPPKRIAIGRAVWRRHGFVSLDAGPESGRLTTRPLLVHGGALVLNSDASRGELRVALLERDGQPLPHFRLEDCEPLRRDATQHRIRWRSGQAVPSDRPVQVVIEMKSARLFSLESVAQ
jgi:hypothetical protein